MFIYATNNGFDKNNMSPVMTWHKGKIVPQNAELNFTYDLKKYDIANIGNGKKEFFVNASGSYCTTVKDKKLKAIVKANDFDDCVNILKNHFPLLNSNNGKKYIGVHIIELGIPTLLSKTYDNLFYLRNK